MSTQTPQSIIAKLCQQYSPMLKVPAGLDPARVLWALAGNESSFGLNSLPRHESAYCYGHEYEVRALSHRWGCASHCSYGPWQMMFSHLVTYLGETAEPFAFVFEWGQSDEHFELGAHFAVKGAVAMLNQEILGRQGATTLDQIAKSWNHGNWRDSFDDSVYQHRAQTNYNAPWPLIIPAEGAGA